MTRVKKVYHRAFICTLALAALTTCSDDATQGIPPCEAPDPPAECSKACTNDGDCGAGFYCGDDGTCTADCTVGGGQCGKDSMCGQDGRCYPTFTGNDGGSSNDGGSDLDCPDVQLSLKPVIPEVMLLIDQSGSMDDPFGEIDGNSVSRWEAVRYALADPTVGAVAKLQSKVRFGATLYHSTGGNAGGECPILTRSAGSPPGQPKLNNLKAIDDLLEDNQPTEDTPTAEAIDEVVADMKQWTAGPDAEPGPRVLLLATDGDPDSCENPDAHDQASQQMSETAVQKGHQAGIQTHVLSVGADVSEAHLEKLANAGVGKPLTPPDEPFYRGNNPAELVAGFDKIIHGVRTCRFILDVEVEPMYEEAGKVTLNGEVLEQGTDWVLVDSSTIELKGDACQTVLNEANVDLKASFPCGAVID